MMSTDEGLLWLYAALTSRGYVVHLQYYGPNVPSNALWIYEGGQSVYVCLGNISAVNRANVADYAHTRLSEDAVILVKKALEHTESWKPRVSPNLPVNPVRSNLPYKLGHPYV
jgi:hypothetical protein